MWTGFNHSHLFWRWYAASSELNSLPKNVIRISWKKNEPTPAASSWLTVSPLYAQSYPYQVMWSSHSMIVHLVNVDCLFGWLVVAGHRTTFAIEIQVATVRMKTLCDCTSFIKRSTNNIGISILWLSEIQWEHFPTLTQFRTNAIRLYDYASIFLCVHHFIAMFSCFIVMK